MNLDTLEQTLYDRLGFASTPQAAVVRRLRSHLNQTQRAILRRRPMAAYRRSILTFTSVANSPFAVLPQAVTRIFAIQDRTNQRNLDEISLGALRDLDPGLTQSSSFPYAYVLMNPSSAVIQQPTVAGAIYVTSTVAGDDGTKTVRVEGIVTGGYPRIDSVALNGAAVVQIGISTGWINLRKISISLTSGAGPTTALGNISILGGAAGAELLSVIPPGRSLPRYSQIQLFPVPTGLSTYYADVELHIEDLATDSDEPLIPEDFHEILIEGALMREFEGQEENPLYDRAKIRYREVWVELCQHAARSADQDAEMISTRWSQLGPYFPAGS